MRVGRLSLCQIGRELVGYPILFGRRQRVIYSLVYKCNPFPMLLQDLFFLPRCHLCRPRPSQPDVRRDLVTQMQSPNPSLSATFSGHLHITLQIKNKYPLA